MKVLRFFLTLILISSLSSLSAQKDIEIPADALNILHNRGEIYFTFRLDDKQLINRLTDVVSIDAVTDTGVVAYANTEEFLTFLTYDLPYQIHPSPGESAKGLTMAGADNMEALSAWDVYPTYDAYIGMMNQYASTYPNLCQVFSIGSTINGRQLLFAKISDNVGTTEAEPRFLYTSSIHGDELTGYILMLRLIDYLLVNYGINPIATNLVDNLEIWINPLANPDGTYKSGNSTVAGAVRYNANSVDLNRNYYDPQNGPHPDGKVWQPETLAFMQMANDYDFAMGANFHGGAEVLNYPWDTWSQLHADNAWWIYVCREYVDTVHAFAPAGYLDDLNNGISNGYAWYEVNGGRQDYMNYFHHCREITMEISATKLPAASTLPNYWNYNYRSLLNYMEQCLYGIHGIITDSATGLPLYSKVVVENHDADNSFIYSVLPNGNFHRPLIAGNYSLTFSSNGHESKTFNNLQVTNRNSTILNVQLGYGSLAALFEASVYQVPAGGEIGFNDLSTGQPVTWNWTFEGGVPENSTLQNPVVRYPQTGSYDVTLTITDSNGSIKTTTKTNYITVISDYKMTNGSFITCQGNFYDSGGSTSNYSSGEDYVITFKPCVPEGKIKVQFTTFNVETQTSCNYDYLSIYNGEDISAPLIGKYCGTTSPGTITASGATGALTFKFHSDGNTTRAGWAATISCNATHTITIPSGWSGLSSYVIPSNANLQTVFQPIAAQLVILQNFNGLYYPALGINTLVNWDVNSGYIVKLEQASAMTFSGSPQLNHTIQLTNGWNLVPLTNWCNVTCQNLEQKLAGHLVVVSEVAGSAIYWPAMGINSLNELIPGKAYFIKVDSDFTFQYPHCP